MAHDCLMEIPFQRIAIIGLGLIGGSWGLALKENAYDGLRIGCDRPETLASALAVGAIDHAQEDPLAAVSHADLVILAAPVGVILNLIPRIKTALSRRVLVTDVGSTKVAICKRARETFGDATLFLGGHPLAGKERSGIENAEAGLFRNSRYALVPQAAENLEDPRVRAFFRLLISAGAQPLVTDALSHDRAVAYLSHLPQLLSTTLAALLAEQYSQSALPLELAGTGLQDMTRLAESPYSVWRDICRTNLVNIQEAVDRLIEKLQGLRQRLSSDSLQSDFDQAGELRQELREKM
ncbi:MAG TPA: prephenate dehydrogenase/arogenate dehydrogenase family protein [Terriglobia bacterium]|nr:prephenate dehydrogenase/arogenate dehydrogenase family protein [Terriglobia bacterium]